MTDTTHLIGLLLGTEEDWPFAFETLLRRLGPVTDGGGGGPPPPPDRRHLILFKKK
jgi:hypothetical protein